MQLVAGPALFVALAVFLGSDIAVAGKLGAHLIEGLRRLTLHGSALAQAVPRLSWGGRALAASARLCALGAAWRCLTGRTERPAADRRAFGSASRGPRFPWRRARRRR